MTDYPSEEQIERIESWPYDDPDGWLAFARSIWRDAAWGWRSYDGVDDFGVPITVHIVSTGGWSGNEEIICAMRRATLLWSLMWHSHRVGGHYEFRVPRRAQP